MYLRSLFLQNFRNSDERDFTFSPKINLICGPNAQGKTTLLEAIYFMMLGRSFRTPQQSDMIKVGGSSFCIESLFNKYGIDQKLRIIADSKSKKIIHNSTVLNNTSNLIGLIQGILMTPDDVNLIKSSPSGRRQFIDFFIAQMDPLYVHHLSRYAKAMRQRNYLLKQKKLSTIDIWEHEMAQAAGYIIKKRKQALLHLIPPSQQFYAYLTEEREQLNIKYLTIAENPENEDEIKEFMKMTFQKNRMKEMRLGFTLAGPHKDDLWIGIGDQEARFFASEGQQRSCVIALQIGAWKNLKQNSEDIPLLMIDDVGMSLDQNRKTKLLQQLSDLGQVFLTTTDSNLLDFYEGEKKIIRL
ncbi:MAG: DNA replication/repair protein RecF [Parachlamydiaceae bacterium]|nr:DNA replication/repair protein RecF [Parachlamydiaceae bacterium]